MINFIKLHLISKIEEQLKEKQAVLKHNNFYYFDEPILYKKKLIDRVNRFNPYFKNEILPSSWYGLDGKVLRDIYLKLKNNQFYIYKLMEDGKSYKTRIKNK